VSKSIFEKNPENAHFTAKPASESGRCLAPLSHRGTLIKWGAEVDLNTLEEAYFNIPLL
jgi:hypothetical protein